MPTIYVLLCEKNRYYVGKTDRPLHTRIEEHFNQNGSEWTRKYKPIKVVEQIPNADEFDEDKYTKKYMKKFGIEYVRGGSYTQLELPDHSLFTLEKELCCASDLCFRCNRPGHFASQCYASSKGSNQECWCCEYCDKTFASMYQANKHEKACKDKNKKRPFLPKLAGIPLEIAEEFLKEEEMTRRQRICSTYDLCYRCNRPGHFASQCYASSKADGSPINEDSSASSNQECWCCEYCDKTFASMYKANKHEKACKNKNRKRPFLPKLSGIPFEIAEEFLEEEEKTKRQRIGSTYDLCYRCNRPGHFASKCYASSKADGSPINEDSSNEEEEEDDDDEEEEEEDDDDEEEEEDDDDDEEAEEDDDIDNDDDDDDEEEEEEDDDDDQWNTYYP